MDSNLLYMSSILVSIFPGGSAGGLLASFGLFIVGEDFTSGGDIKLIGML